MQTQPHTNDADLKLEKSVPGRRDSHGNEENIKTKPFKDGYSEARKAVMKTRDAKEKENAIFKALGEKSNMKTAVLRRAVCAEMDDKIDDLARDAEQIGLALEIARENAAK